MTSDRGSRRGNGPDEDEDEDERRAGGNTLPADGLPRESPGQPAGRVFRVATAEARPPGHRPRWRVLDNASTPGTQDASTECVEQVVVMHDRPTLLQDVPDLRATILLRERPTPWVTYVRDLVSGAVLSLRLRLVPEPADLLDAAEPLRPVWPQAQSLVLRDGSTVVSEAVAVRDGSLALSGRLTRKTALALLDTLFDDGDVLSLTGEVRYAAQHGEGRAVVDCALHEIVGVDALRAMLVLAVDGPTGAVFLPPRRAERASRNVRRGPTADAPVMTTGATVAALPFVLRGNAPLPKGHVLFAAGHLVRPAVMDLRLDDLVVGRPPRPMPLVTDLGAPFWVDVDDTAVGWYAPALEIVDPAADEARDDPSFRFSFERRGVTAAGQPALFATIRLGLRASRSPETDAALNAAGVTRAQSVELDGLAVHLAIPFVDADSGQTKRHQLAGVVAAPVHGVHQIEFTLAGDWVRLAYGALARPGFQSEAAQVEVAYHFAGASERGENPVPVFGSKVATVPILARSASTKTSGVHLVREDLSVWAGRRNLVKLTKERKATTVATSGVVRPMSTTVLSIRPDIVVPKPPPAKLGRRTYARRRSLPLLVDCAAHGHLYLDATDEPPRAVGCADALQLGTVQYRIFEPLPALSTTRYDVDRSVSQPDRYLLRPTTYRIGRREPDTEGPGREPLVLLYANLAAADPAANRVVFDATLLPDVTPAERATLTAQLRASSGREVDLLLPTEVDHTDLLWQWNVMVPDTEVVAMVLPGGGVRATFSTSITYWPLLRSQLETGGVVGSAAFELDDGSRIPLALELDLRHLTGPFHAGPVEAVRTNSEVRLINRIETDVAVSSVLVVAEDGTITTTPIEQVLTPGAELTTDLSGTAGAVVIAHDPVGRAPIVLDEIRSYVENVETTVAFVNLINLGNHDLSGIELDARIAGTGPDRRLVLTTDEPVGEATFVLPLTRHLAGPRLDYRVTTVDGSGTRTTSDWTTWDLARAGVVISLMWQDIDDGGSQ